MTEFNFYEAALELVNQTGNEYACISEDICCENRLDKCKAISEHMKAYTATHLASTKEFTDLSVSDHWQLFLSNFNLFRGAKEGKVYWRATPTLESKTDYTKRITARVFIAD